MKKILCLILTVILLCTLLSSCADKGFEDVTATEEKTEYVLITVKDFGKILIKLCPDEAPVTVENFQNLVADDFYDGLIFHRVIKGFMIQGGCPKGNGTGGSGTNIVGEFSANGYENNLKHERGVVSMARSQAMDSASSQFFICHEDENVGHLDGQYAAFGYVMRGMDVVDEIASVKTNSSDKPLTKVVIESIEFVTISE